VRTTRLLRRGAVLACGAALTATAAAEAQAPRPEEGRMLYATTGENTVIGFDARQPQRILARRPITGLGDGVTLKGIDFRPRTGDLYGVGSNSAVYRIDPRTGIAVAEGPAFAPLLTGRSFGVDFNPTVDKIRVVSDAAQNLRLNPDDGNVLSADGNLNPGTPQVVAAAYTNSGFSVNVAPATTLFVVDAATDQIYTQNPPNNGTLTNGKPLGIDADAETELDIAGDDNVGYLVTKGTLHTVDPATGATHRVGRIGKGRRAITGLAAWQDYVVNPAPPAMMPSPAPAPGPSPAPTPIPTPTPSPSPAPSPPSGGTRAFASIDPVPRITLARFVRSGVRVSASCGSRARGSIRIEIPRGQASRLGLRGTTLATRSVRCNGFGLIARVTPSAKAKRALRGARGSVTATVRLKLGSARDSARLVLRRRA
jgi:hypothetical protein